MKSGDCFGKAKSISGKNGICQIGKKNALWASNHVSYVELSFNMRLQAWPKPTAEDFHVNDTLRPKCFSLLLKHRQTIIGGLKQRDR